MDTRPVTKPQAQRGRRLGLVLLRQRGVGGDAVSVEQRYERKIKRGIRRRYSKLCERLARALAAIDAAA